MQRNRSRGVGAAIAEPPTPSVEEGEAITGALEAQRMQSIVENMPTALILAGTDLVISYLNPASLNTLKKLEQYLPCMAEEIVGKSIDIFYKNPEDQRRLLANPNNLPHRAVGEVGPEKLDLLVSAINDEEGNYLGPMVTWEAVTEKLAAEQREKDAAENERRQQEEWRGKVDSMLTVVQAAMQGDLTTDVTVAGEDAVGQMGEGLRDFFKNLRGTLGRLAENAQQLGASSEELTAVSQQMASNAEETSTQAGVVSAASEEVSKNVQVVATGTEEMSASIREIAKSSNEAARVAKQAVGVADSANSTISELGDASVEIGKVIKPGFPFWP